MENNFETIRLSLEHLASVGGGGNTVVITGQNCTVGKPTTDKATGDTRIPVTCKEGTVDIKW